MDDIYNYTQEQLHQDETKRKEVYEAMLRELERAGLCRHVFHRLALVLFNDPLSDYEPLT